MILCLRQPRPISRRRSVGLAAFCRGFDARVNAGPAAYDTLAVIFFNQAEREMAEFDQGAAGLFAQAILQIGRNGIGHEEWAGEFEERGTLDGLDVRPEVAVLAAKVAEPTAAGPGFELHRHWALLWHFVARAELLEEGSESFVD